VDLIIIRHAATDDNSRGVVRNNSKQSLSAQGRQQAKDLASKLKYEHIAAIYSSDYQRSIDTAEILHAYHKNVPLQFASEIQEMHGGGTFDKIGFPPSVVVNGIQLLRLLHLKTPGGESWKELCARVESFLNKTYEKHPNDKVVLVTHGITMQAMRSLLEDNRGIKFRLKEVPNCTVWRVGMNKKIIT
jgi:broad specificity phosphatase PhoE